MSSESLRVRRIREGTVIDHIPAGTALSVLKILGVTGKEGYVIAVVMNVESEKIGKKDIVKIEDRELAKEEVDKIALIAPTATINIIRNYEVVQKYRVNLPDIIIGLIECTNPTCITRRENEPIEATFKVVSRDPLKLQCTYCGTYLTREDVISQLTR